MKQYKIKRDINGTLKVVGFEYHSEAEGKEVISHKKRKVELKRGIRILGAFPVEPGDIKDWRNNAT